MSVEIIQSLVDSFNVRDWDAARRYLSDDLEFADLAMGHTAHGPDEFLAYAQAWAGAFSDMQLELRAAVGDDRHAAGDFVGRGTHDGPMPSPEGEIPATGRSMEEPFVWFCEVADGKLTAIRDYYNPLSIMSQLGLVPEQAQA
jgi:steroid delta-isomerase-like uncharacterized protein